MTPTRYFANFFAQPPFGYSASVFLFDRPHNYSVRNEHGVLPHETGRSVVLQDAAEYDMTQLRLASQAETIETYRKQTEDLLHEVHDLTRKVNMYKGLALASGYGAAPKDTIALDELPVMVLTDLAFSLRNAAGRLVSMLNVGLNGSKTPEHYRERADRHIALAERVEAAHKAKREKQDAEHDAERRTRELKRRAEREASASIRALQRTMPSACPPMAW